MPPQPLSSKRRKNMRFDFTPDRIEERPELAILVAKSIAIWAVVENQWGRILATMLGANATYVLAMYQVLTGGNAQRDALLAVAEKALPPDLLEMFVAIGELARPLAKVRNKMAHWLWGVAHEMPDALLLYDPDATVRMHHEVNEFIREIYKLDAAERSKMERPQDDLSAILVFSKRDLLEIIDEMNKFRRHMIMFTIALQHFDNLRKIPPDLANSLVSQAMQRLLDEPDIQEVLNRLRQNQKKTLSKQKQQRQKRQV